MANYRNLRRQAEDAQKKYARYNEIMSNYNAQIDAYNAAGSEFNSWMNQIKIGQSTGLAEYENGKWAQLGSHEGDYAWSNRDPKTGKPYDATVLLGSRAELDAQSPGVSQNFGSEYGQQWYGNSYWVRNDDGTATKYTGVGSTSTINPGEPGYVAPVPQWGGEGSGVDQWVLPDGSLTTQNPNVRQQASWEAGPTLRIAAFETPAPVEPDVSVPRASFTNSQIKEMQNPTMDAAGAVLGETKGYGVKTSEANAGPTANSALAGLDPEDQFKDKGILARVLGGDI